MATKTKTNPMAYELLLVKQFKGKTYIGQIDYKKKTITLALSGGISGINLTEAQIMQTYYHEVVHAVLHGMKHPLNADEKFVDAFAQRLCWYARAKNDNDARSKNADSLVTQRTKRLRELRKEVPRSKSAKKVQAR